MHENSYAYFRLPFKETMSWFPLKAYTSGRVKPAHKKKHRGQHHSRSVKSVSKGNLDCLVMLFLIKSSTIYGCFQT